MRRYLIIDDRSDDPERLRKILREEGYGVTESPGWPGFMAEQEQVKEALSLSEQKYRAIIDNAPFGIFRSTVEGKFISVNPTLAVLLGYDSPEDLLQACNNSTIHDRLYIDPEVRNAMVESALREGGWQVRQNSYRRKDGSIITGNIYMRAAPDSGNKGIELEGFVEDITERKGAEEKIRAALAEKELLLKEVHHRVKNNLQIISTLLDLQADNIRDENLLNALKVSQDRIKAMSLIHERLYQSSDLVRIDFWEYIESLVGHLLSSYVDDPRRIVMKVDVGDFQMGIDRAIPCGLIINELVSNAMKHAFPNGRNGEIAIRLHADERGWITLTVADDGVGVPHGLDFNKTETLGLQLVSMLAKQLRGQIEMSCGHGTLWVISFSKMDNSKSASA